jgi:creatinine amidohydrolase
VNGHGGNSFAAEELAGEGVRWHDWWRSGRIRALVDEIDPEASHASWMENFPWTRLDGVELPEGHKGALVLQDVADPREFRQLAGDGSFGGFYERPDEVMLQIWEAAVDEVRALLESGWDA